MEHEHLTTNEKELYSLVEYFRKYYAKLKTLKTEFPTEELRFMRIVDELEQLLRKFAAQRKNTEQEKLKPKLSLCPKCLTEKKRIPAGEEKDAHDYMCNVYHCDKCNSKFTDAEPNNAADQLKWVEEMMDVFGKTNNITEALPKQLQKDLKEFKKQHKIFKKIFNEEEEAREDSKKAEQEWAESVIKMRDYLQLAKLSMQFPNMAKGES